MMRIGAESADLELMLIESGQCFSWRRGTAGYLGAPGGRAVCLYQSEGHICADGDVDCAALRHYLDLNRDYSPLAEECGAYPQAVRALKRYPGLRVMNQPPWEALVAFILSANNNISRIRGLVERLCGELGEKLACGGETVYAYPTPQALADAGEARLRALGVGYRAPYLIASARRVLEGFDLSVLRQLPYAEAHARLTTLAGVGDKVADCVLLFGCEQAAAIPVDVWVERVLAEGFGLAGLSRRAMAQAAREKLGTHAGLIQQFLFHAARMGTWTE